MSQPERILIREEPVPGTSLNAQWWQTGEQVEVMVQRPPIGTVRDVAFRWLLSEDEADLLARRVSGADLSDADIEAIETMLRDLIDALLVGAYLRSKSKQETKTP